jgi:hypothetical protein
LNCLAGWDKQQPISQKRHPGAFAAHTGMYALFLDTLREVAAQWLGVPLKQFELKSHHIIADAAGAIWLGCRRSLCYHNPDWYCTPDQAALIKQTMAAGTIQVTDFSTIRMTNGGAVQDKFHVTESHRKLHDSMPANKQPAVKKIMKEMRECETVTFFKANLKELTEIMNNLEDAVCKKHAINVLAHELRRYDQMFGPWHSAGQLTAGVCESAHHMWQVHGLKRACTAKGIHILFMIARQQETRYNMAHRSNMSPSAMRKEMYDMDRPKFGWNRASEYMWNLINLENWSEQDTASLNAFQQELEMPNEVREIDLSNTNKSLKLQGKGKGSAPPPSSWNN